MTATLVRRLGLSLCVALLTVTAAGCSPGGADVAATETPEARVDDVRSLAVLGDSISLGVNACAAPGPCTEGAWVEGEGAIDSVEQRIESATGMRPTILNASRSGARLEDLTGAVDDVVAADPDVVVLLAGANDVCTSAVGTVTPESEFGAQASSLLGDLRSSLPDASLVVMSLPDVYTLWEALHTDPDAVRTWSDARICRSLLADATSTAVDDVQRRNLLALHVERLNDALDDACAAVPGCTYDDGRLHSLVLSEDEVSHIDFFHPSEAGQAAIADVVWQEIVEARSS